MADVTQILNAIERGNPQAAEELLPLVYEELRRLAAHKMSQEPPGQTLQATALVHEAYIRLVEVKDQSWNSRLLTSRVKWIRHSRNSRSLKVAERPSF